MAPAATLPQGQRSSSPSFYLDRTWAKILKETDEASSGCGTQSNSSTNTAMNNTTNLTIHLTGDRGQTDERWQVETLAGIVLSNHNVFCRFTKLAISTGYGPDESYSETFLKGLADLVCSMPNLKELSLQLAHESVAVLLQNLQDMPQIKKLSLYRGVSNHFCHCIGQMTQLEHLAILNDKYYDEYTSVSGESNALVQALQKLPNLQGFFYHMSTPLDDTHLLQPLLDVLHQKTTLKEVQIQSLGYLNNQQESAIKTFPRIHKAVQEQNLPHDLLFKQEHLEGWIQAMVNLNDRLDCFHYLFSSLPPFLYAKSTPPPPPSLPWDEPFLQRLKQALAPPKKTGRRSQYTVTPAVFPIKDTQLLTDQQERDELWSKVVVSNNTPVPTADSPIHQKWIQGLDLLTKPTLQDVARTNCSELSQDDVHNILSVLFPSLKETLQYTHMDPLDMQHSIRILQTFLAGQAHAASSSSQPAAIWPHYDARWTHLRPQDRLRLQPPTTTTKNLLVQPINLLKPSIIKSDNNNNNNNNKASPDRTLKRKRSWP